MAQPGVYQGCSPYDCVICCSNVKTSKITNKINDNEGPDATMITKLQFIAPEIQWCQQSYICETCTGDLFSACMFKERCLKSQHLRIKTEPVDEDYSFPENKPGYEDKDYLDVVNFAPPSEEEILIETHSIKDTMEDDNKKECVKCGIKCTSLSSLKTHELVCDGIIGQHDKSKTKFKCDRCNKCYMTNKILKGHIKNCELKTANLSANQCVDLDCDQSMIQDQEELTLDRQSIPHKTCRMETFLCEVCQAKFTRLKDIVEHCETKHSMDVKTIKPYLCETCNARFRASSYLRAHQQRHIRDRSYLCIYCGKRFIKSDDLSQHEKIHSQIRAYKCDLCDKTFKTNSNLRNHKFVVHTTPSEWKHICNICGKRFSQKTVMDAHVQRHLGKKNFICHICDKGFITKEELNVHVASHSNVSAFKCELCKKEYRHRSPYKRHLKKMHGIGNVKLRTYENKFTCHICPAKFPYKGRLARHLLVHSGVKPFPCTNCDKKFTDRSYLKQHLRLKHNVESV